MPYKEITDLPQSVHDSLPKHAQEIYQAAFNSAWEEYGPGQASERRSKDDDPEEVAHRVAWAAVKKQYERVKEGEWKRKS